MKRNSIIRFLISFSIGIVEGGTLVQAIQNTSIFYVVQCILATVASAWVAIYICDDD